MRSTWLGVVVGVALSSCAAPSRGPAPVVGSAAPFVSSAPPEPAEARVVVSGRIRAHDGGPLAAGEVVLRRNGFEEVAAQAVLDPNGRFSLEVAPGPYFVQIAGVDHAMTRRTTIVDGALEVTGNLGTYDRSEPGATLAIRAEFLDAAGVVVGPATGEASSVRPGVYRLPLGERPPTATRLRVQLVGKGGRTFNAPAVDGFTSDGGGDYWTFVELQGRDAVEIDVGRLPPSGRPTALTWRGESLRTARLIADLERWTSRVRAFQQALPRTDGKLVTMTAADHAAAAELYVQGLAEADAIADDDARTLLRAAQIDAFATFLELPGRHAEVLAWILAHVDPLDPALGLLSGLDYAIVSGVRVAGTELAGQAEAWLERRVEHADPAVAITALAVLLDQADRRRDDAALRSLYSRVVEPRYAGTYYRSHLALQYDPEHPLRRGKSLPAFDFAALDGDGRVTSDRDGLYLLEFWATWCGPCVAEMPTTQRAYAAINGVTLPKPRRRNRGKTDDPLRRLGRAGQPRVEFVFVSFDADRQDVRGFRTASWSMPWVHAFVGSNGQRDVMKRLAFTGVPTAILVDASGVIVESGVTLRGEQLLPTLERVVAERAAAQ